MIHTSNPRTREAEARGSLWVWGQPHLQSKFENSQSYYTEKHCLEGKKHLFKYIWNTCYCLQGRNRNKPIHAMNYSFIHSFAYYSCLPPSPHPPLFFKLLMLELQVCVIISNFRLLNICIYLVMRKDVWLAYSGPKFNSNHQIYWAWCGALDENFPL